MNRKTILILLVTLFLAACSSQIDNSGQDTEVEVMVYRSPS